MGDRDRLRPLPHPRALHPHQLQGFSPSGGGRSTFPGLDVVPADLPLALINGLMDEVVVREGSGGRTTTLTKQLR